MPKPKLADFKRLINEMTEAELREKLLKLFNKLEQIQMFHAQDLMTKEGRLKLLEEAKRKVYNEYWARMNNPCNVDNAKSIINNFEKSSAFPNKVIKFRTEL